MSGVCKISSTESQWKIPKDMIEKIYPLLYKNDEMGGEFVISKNGEITHFKLVKGHNDSVQVPDSIVNFHTHPVTCYVNEKTVYGWPSGEDVRETILFSMKGSILHMVIAVEGVYTMKCTDCVLKKLIHMENSKYIQNVMSSLYSGNSKLMKKFKNSSKTKFTEFLRGVIILYVEIYFRATHAFRSDEITGNISPEDYIKFINAFRLNKLFNGDNNNSKNECGNIKCVGVPVYDNKKTKNYKDFGKYINDYESDTPIFAVTKKGSIYNLNNIKIKDTFVLLPYLKKFIFECGCMNTRWFNVNLFPNDVYGKNYIKGYNISKKKGILKDLMKTKRGEDITLTVPYIEFKYRSIKGICSHKDITNHIHKKENRTSLKKFKKMKKKRKTKKMKIKSKRSKRKGRRKKSKIKVRKKRK